MRTKFSRLDGLTYFLVWTLRKSSANTRGVAFVNFGKVGRHIYMQLSIKRSRLIPAKKLTNQPEH